MTMRFAPHPEPLGVALIPPVTLRLIDHNIVRFSRRLTALLLWLTCEDFPADHLSQYYSHMSMLNRMGV